MDIDLQRQAYRMLHSDSLNLQFDGSVCVLLNKAPIPNFHSLYLIPNYCSFHYLTPTLLFLGLMGPDGLPSVSISAACRDALDQ